MVRLVYVLKGAGTAYAASIQKVMRYLVFQPCMDDSDLWMRSDVDTSAIESDDVSINQSSNNLHEG